MFNLTDSMRNFELGLEKNITMPKTGKRKRKERNNLLMKTSKKQRVSMKNQSSSNAFYASLSAMSS